MEPILIKISGGLISDPNGMEPLYRWLAKQFAKGQSAVIVHGAGKQADELSEKLQLHVRKVDGRRITDASTMDIITQLVGGLVNKRLVSMLRQNGINAVGITAADGNLTTSVRRKPMEINGESVDFGFVGEITNVDTDFLERLLDSGYIPVIGCITWSKTDGLLNINADTLALKLASALNCKRLVLQTPSGAVLGKDGKPLSHITLDQFNEGKKEGWINEGMLLKLNIGFQAGKHGISEVVVCSPESLENGGETRIIINEQEQ